jgi:hypothetical protein
MSLRKSPQLTPQLLAASRHNAQHSTGPRSPAAKQNSKLNALKHGAYVSNGNHRQAMLALGEDPEQFQTLTEELRRAFGPGDALWEKQILNSYGTRSSSAPSTNASTPYWNLFTKVRILLRLRKEFSSLPTAPPGQGDGARMENIEEALDSDNMPYTYQSVGVVKHSKMKGRCGNVYENKGPLWKKPERSGNVTENKGSYAFKVGMLLKRKEVVGTQ